MTELLCSVVQGDEADLSPYPYVYVIDDGSYRELSNDEKVYLQREFSPFDGDRPYVKSRYWQVTPDAKMSGFLHRKQLPLGLQAGEIPEPKKWWEFWRR